MEPNYDVYMIHEFSVNPFFMNKFNFSGRFQLEDADESFNQIQESRITDEGKNLGNVVSGKFARSG